MNQLWRLEKNVSFPENFFFKDWLILLTPINTHLSENTNAKVISKDSFSKGSYKKIEKSRTGKTEQNVKASENKKLSFFSLTKAQDFINED